MRTTNGTVKLATSRPFRQPAKRRSGPAQRGRQGKVVGFQSTAGGFAVFEPPPTAPLLVNFAAKQS